MPSLRRRLLPPSFIHTFCYVYSTWSELAGVQKHATTARGDGSSVVRDIIIPGEMRALTSSDLSTPQCGRCIKARLECGGPRGITIIPFNGQRRPLRSISSAPVDSCPVGTGATALVNFGQLNLQLQPGPSFSRDDIFISFTRSTFMPEADFLWLAPGTIAAESFMALATTYFGIKRQERAIAQYGFKRYSEALKNVHAALEEFNSSQSVDLLEAVMIMALIEVCRMCLSWRCCLS